LALTLFNVHFHRFPGAKIFIYKRLLIRSSRKYFENGAAAGKQNVVRTLAVQNFDRWNEIRHQRCARVHTRKTLLAQ